MSRNNDVIIIYTGEPVPFDRARSNGSRRYTAPKQAAFMAQLGMLANRAMAGREPLDGPIQMAARFQYVAPVLRRDERWKVSTPDLDNLVKITADALNKIVWKDDARVVKLDAEKVYGPDARVVLHISQADARQPS